MTDISLDEEMNKTEVISELINILWLSANNRFPAPEPSRTVKGREFITNSYENAFFNRVLGFKGELHYSQRTCGITNIINGGWFVNKGLCYGTADFTKDTVYFSVTKSLSEKYQLLYSLIAKALPEIELYLIKYSVEAGLSDQSYTIYSFINGQFLLMPQRKFFEQFKEKASLSNLASLKTKIPVISAVLKNRAYKALFIEEVDKEIYQDVLYDRFFFDIVLSGSYKKGRPTDIDHIQLNADKKQLMFIDVKEKYPYKNKVGINEDHLPFFTQMESAFRNISDWEFDNRYLVRLTNGADDPSFRGWYHQSISHFYEADSAGGNQGQNGTGAMKTKMLSIEKMRLLV